MNQTPDSTPLLKIGLPKGSLEEPTIDLFDRAGYNISVRSRSYTPDIDDPELSCVMFRAVTARACSCPDPALPAPRAPPMRPYALVPAPWSHGDWPEVCMSPRARAA